MFEERYEKLGMTDRENFSRIVNQLLAHTYVTVDEYDPSEETKKLNKDYSFIDNNYEIFQEYFSYAGFRLEKDSGYGVIYLTSSYEGNRVRFDKLTTFMVYTLRLIYEEEREKLSLSDNIIITTGDLVHKLISLGVVKKKPANAQLHVSFMQLSRFRVVQKIEGAWEAADTRFLILPTILFIVSNEQISNMYRLTDDDRRPEERQDEEEAEDGYEEIE